MTYFGRFLVFVISIGFAWNVEQVVIGQADWLDGVFLVAQAFCLITWFFRGEKVFNE